MSIDMCCICACMHAYGGQRLTSHVFFNNCSLYFVIQDLLLSLVPIDWPESSQDPPVCLPTARIIGVYYHARLLNGVLGIWCQSSCLHSKHINIWYISPVFTAVFLFYPFLQFGGDTSLWPYFSPLINAWWLSCFPSPCLQLFLCDLFRQFAVLWNSSQLITLPLQLWKSFCLFVPISWHMKLLWSWCISLVHIWCWALVW